MPDPLEGYTVNLGNRARRFMRRHPDLKEQWEREIIKVLEQRPREGPRINHMKGQYNCSHRWRTSTYRILYDVFNDDHVVEVYDADVRGDIY